MIIHHPRKEATPFEAKGGGGREDLVREFASLFLTWLLNL